MPRSSSMEAIQDFLSVRRLAMVGVSRNPNTFSAMLFQELCRRGYDVIPVNPHAAMVLGKPCFARVEDIQPPVDAALLMTSPRVTETVVEDCARAGIRRVWMYSAGGTGATSDQAIAFCREHNIQVIPGECPFMFFPNNGFHRVHGWVRRITGSYPNHHAARIEPPSQIAS